MTLTTYLLEQGEPDGQAWLISNWDQGFASPTEWQADNVYQEGESTFLQLDAGTINEPGTNQFAGAEIQSNVEASTGTWSWQVKAPEMVPGAVFGMFLFQADWGNPRLEFDMEIVGDDPTKIEIVTHMAMADGRVKTVYRIVQLDFDPSADVNDYEVSLDGTSATFRINDEVVATFDKEDFGGYWRSGEVRSYTNLWATQHSAWAGTIDPATLPIRAEILDSGWGSDVVAAVNWIGTPEADHYRGTALDDTLGGADGADLLHGEAGTDSIYGEGGDDALYGWTGADHIHGGSGHDQLFGEAGDDRLHGGDGDDTLDGGAGNDTLQGGAGIDTLRGGLGADTYLLSVAGDVIVEAPDGGGDTVLAGYTYTLLGNLENLLLTGTGNLKGTGNELGNHLVGNSGSNVLVGRGGNDTLQGGAGVDRLDGGAGNDIYITDAADVVMELASGGTADLIRSAFSRALDANVEHLELLGTARINGTGNALANSVTGNSGVNTLSGLGGNDILQGGGGADRLLGGAGHDRLQGGAGLDNLSGGLGNDSFVFASRAQAGDVITDFRNVVGDNDDFRIGAAAFGGGLEGGRQLLASQFQVAMDNVLQGPAEANIRFIFEIDATKLWFDSNGSAAGGLMLVADLQAGARMGPSDIWLM